MWQAVMRHYTRMFSIRTRCSMLTLLFKPGLNMCRQRSSYWALVRTVDRLSWKKASNRVHWPIREFFFVFCCWNIYDCLGFVWFRPVSGSGTAGKFTREDGSLAYYEICEKLLVDKWKYVWNEQQKVPYAYSNEVLTSSSKPME